MQKFTIFTIIFSLAVILVMAELVINDYLESEKNLQTNVIKEIEGVDEKSDSSNIDEEQANFKIIDEALLREAGFKDVSFKKVAFSGKIFQLLALPGINNDKVNKLNIFQGQNFAATLYQIALNSSEASDELYDYIRNNLTNKPNLAINETNQFGENSFYINNTNKKKIAFLVVMIGSELYGFEYAHQYHPIIKSLISLLES